MNRRELAELIDARLRRGRWLNPQTPQGSLVWCPHPATTMQGAGVRATERREKVRKRELEEEKFGHSHHPVRVPAGVVAEAEAWIALHEFAFGLWNVPAPIIPIHISSRLPFVLDEIWGEKA